MVELGDAASHGATFVDLKLFPLPIHRLFASNFCPSTLQPANWTLKIDVTVLHFDGRIANHKENWTGVSPGVTPRPSTGHTLMGLHCIHWILQLQQNLRIQSQSPEQKLCHKASGFYGKKSRPFTYVKPSIAARSSGAAFDQVDTLSQMKRDTSFLLVSNYV